MTTRRVARDYNLVITVTSPDLERAAANLDAVAQGRLMQEATRELHATRDELVGKVRKSINRIPSRGTARTHSFFGLRLRLQQNVEGRFGASTTRAWLRIEMNPNGLPEGLAAAMDDKSFRHPVFGNREIWVAQRSYPYFRRTLKGQKRVTDAAMRRAIDTVMDEVTAGLKGQGT